MNDVAPNLSALLGELIGARLISQAGSLINLAKFPSSTVQIIGAEKALFRALKTRGNTPKYGLLYHSSYIGRAKAKDKGKISRYIANKCSLAARLDAYAILPTNKFGEKMKEQVEERLKFLETGEPTQKNIDIMKEVLDELKAENLYFDNPEDAEKKKKKKKKAKKVVEAEPEENLEEEVAQAEGKKKKKKVKTE